MTLTINPNTSPVDELGILKAQIADLTKKAEAIKTELIASGVGEYDGALFCATVTEVKRSFIDADLARKYLDLTKKAEAIKTELIASGVGEYDGALFRATVTEVKRSFIDADLARKYLDEQTLAKITKVCGTVTVRVTARKAV
jgi:hypothetical protein